MSDKFRMYVIGKEPEEHDFRKCPECGHDTLEWIFEDVGVWSCECGYEESDPEDWTVPLVDGMIFCADDGSDKCIVKNGRLEYMGDKK